MSRVRLGGLAVAVVALIAGAWALSGRPARSGSWVSGQLPAAAREAIGSPSAAVAAPPGPTGAPASAAKAARTRPSHTAAPFVQTFAAQPGVKPLPPRRSPAAPVRVDITVDGCDHNYGTRTQCVPLTFPAGVTDKCEWLAQHGYRGLKVTGTDRQRLDPDGNDVACDNP
jgi:hypothetical protein